MALAGNIAFRALLAIFPFLIFTSSLTAFIGDRGMADGLVAFLIAILPSALVEPLVSEVMNVLTIQRSGVLSIGGLLTIWFALGGVDGVRVGLNRAYEIPETRSIFVIFVLEVLIVVFAGLAFVLVSYLLVLAPWADGLLDQFIPGYEPASATSRLIRYPASAAILVFALFVAHIFLPARRTRFSSMWPGVPFTVSAWAVLAAVFSQYLSSFADYANYYAGLAGIIAGILFPLSGGPRPP